MTYILDPAESSKKNENSSAIAFECGRETTSLCRAETSVRDQIPQGTITSLMINPHSVQWQSSRGLTVWKLKIASYNTANSDVFIQLFPTKRKPI